MQPSRVVRKPLTVRARPRRTPEENLIVRFPGLAGPLLRALARLTPGSRIRQALLWRLMEQGFAAVNRRDFDVVLPFYDPEVEFIPAPALVSLGIAPSYLGRDGFVAIWEDWDSAWAGHGQWDPKELIDLGDRVLMLGRISGIGEASGIAVDTEIALVYTLRDGRVIREQHYMSHAQALEAVGLGRSAQT